MGLDITALQLLLLARRTHGLNLGQTAILGRQRIFLSAKEIAWAKRQGLRVEAGAYAEVLLAALGAGRIDTVDASDYEGATIVADFNQPIPKALCGVFSTYLDFGSMEHVFDIRRVVLNVNHLLEPGGAAIMLTICDGMAGHGFYQFAPEFFHSVFGAANGFEQTDVYVIEVERRDCWRKVPSPASRGYRIMTPVAPLAIACVTRKSRRVEQIVAQQSDYAALWGGGTARRGVAKSGKWQASLQSLQRFLASHRMLRQRIRLFEGSTTAFDIGEAIVSANEGAWVAPSAGEHRYRSSN